ANLAVHSFVSFGTEDAFRAAAGREVDPIATTTTRTDDTNTDRSKRVMAYLWPQGSPLIGEFPEISPKRQPLPKT
ncbi:MAG: hypothetical protein WBV36_24660, partial [Terriglobales bacterium]